jgi:hypothetical protein
MRTSQWVGRGREQQVTLNDSLSGVELDCPPYARSNPAATKHGAQLTFMRTAASNKSSPCDAAAACGASCMHAPFQAKFLNILSPDRSHETLQGGTAAQDMNPAKRVVVVTIEQQGARSGRAM